MQYVTNNYPAMSYSFEFPWKILVNSILNSQKLLFVDGSSRDGLYVWDVCFLEKSFLGLQKNKYVNLFYDDNICTFKRLENTFERWLIQSIYMVFEYENVSFSDSCLRSAWSSFMIFLFVGDIHKN